MTRSFILAACICLMTGCAAPHAPQKEFPPVKDTVTYRVLVVTPGGWPESRQLAQFDRAYEDWRNVGLELKFEPINDLADSELGTVDEKDWPKVKEIAGWQRTVFLVDEAIQNKKVYGGYAWPNGPVVLAKNCYPNGLSHEIGHQLTLPDRDTWNNLMHSKNYSATAGLDKDQIAQALGSLKSTAKLKTDDAPIPAP